MRIIVALIVSGVLTVLAYIYQPWALIVTLPAFVASLGFGLKEHERQQQTHGEEIYEVNAQLHSELLAAHNLVCSAYNLTDSARDEVLTVLIDAARHLADPGGTSRIYYEDDSSLFYKNAGLKLVERANSLLKMRTHQPVDNQSAGVLYTAIKEKDEKAIHEALIGKSEAIGFVFWHSHEKPTLTSDWSAEMASNCKEMGFELRLDTIKNPDLTGHMDELYKTIVYISY